MQDCALLRRKRTRPPPLEPKNPSAKRQADTTEPSEQHRKVSSTSASLERRGRCYACTHCSLLLCALACVADSHAYASVRWHWPRWQGSNRGANEMALDANSGMPRARHACDLALLICDTSPPLALSSLLAVTAYRPTSISHSLQPCPSLDQQRQLLLSAPWGWVSGGGACTTVRVVYESADGCCFGLAVCLVMTWVFRAKVAARSSV